MHGHGDRSQHAWRIAGMAWLLCCAILILYSGRPLTHVQFIDPDDAMRLEQVRAWLAGQSWFDVTQYRINPPDGAPMHWSRIVDLPIAALILIARPLVGQTAAEIFSIMTVPLLLLGGLVAATFITAQRLIAGNRAPLVATIMLLTAASILVQFRPFRIDHHGWQILMGAVATCGLLDPRPRRGGLVMGVALAVWLAISSEGLPYAALYLGVAGVAHLLRPQESARLVHGSIAIGAGSLILSVATRGLAPLQSIQCDALTMPYLYPLIMLAIVTPIASLAIGNGNVRRRAMVGAAGAGAAAITLALVGGPCLSGDPFQTLGPVAYRLWYMGVMEGRPFWEQDLTRIGVILIPPLFGLAATIAAAHAHRHDPERLRRWLLLCLLLGGAALVAAMVMRALSMAHWLTIPGMTWLVMTLLAKIQRSPSAIRRVLGSASLIVLTPLGLSSLWIAVAAPFTSPTAATNRAELQCNPSIMMDRLGGLPPAMLFAPLDIGPTILVRTHHDIVATGHHRNAAGITAVIRGFVERPDKARAAIAGVNGGKGADYIVTCSDLEEYRAYARIAPQGLAAQLARGHAPDWLTPLPSDGPLNIWRIRRE